MESSLFLLSFILTTLLVLSALDEVVTLECYVCKNQEDNKNKCVETVKICDVHHEQCLSEVRWGSTPYWSLTSQKQFYISKRCATKYECNLAAINNEKKCERISYNDWNCTTCCSGDKCNYYVTLGTARAQPSLIILTITTSLTFIAFLTNMRKFDEFTFYV